MTSAVRRPSTTGAEADMLRVLDQGGFLSVAQAKALLGLSKSKLYELMEEGTLPHCAIGRRRLIPRTSLAQFLAGNLRQN